MKKIIFSVIALASFCVASAQDQNALNDGFSKGDTFITGQVSFYTQKTEGNKDTEFSIGPSVGYFVTDNIALGGGFTYGHKWSKTAGFDEKNTQNSYAPSVFGRYYFTPQNKFSLFVHTQAAYKYYEYRYDGNVVQHDNSFAATAGGGINYFITPHLALQSTLALLQYSTNTSNAMGSKNETDVFTASLALSNIQFGLNYKF